MARIEYIRSLIGGVEAALKTTLNSVFEYLLNNLRLGRPNTSNRRAENLQWYYYEATTHAVANTQFSVEHGLARAPYSLIPHLNLQLEGAKLVPLAIPRVADARRVYLSSPDTDAPISFYLEA
jgi:hypothetical protein